MKKNSVVSMVKPNICYLFLLIVLFVSGCASMAPTIPDERKIILVQGETITGDFKNGSLQLQYSYSLTGSTINLNGKLTYQGAFDSLDVRVLFLDSTGTVLHREFIYSSGFRTFVRRVSNHAFQKTFPVPVGSKAITFEPSVREHSGSR